MHGYYRSICYRKEATASMERAVVAREGLLTTGNSEDSHLYILVVERRREYGESQQMAFRTRAPERALS